MEKTVQLWVAREGEAALEIHGNTVLLETLSKDMDGIFPTEEDWREFAESIDAHGVYYIGRQKLLGGEESGVRYKDQYVTYSFPDGIQVVTGFQIKNGERTDVISEVTSITFRFRYDWYWTNESREGATMLEIEGEYVSCG